MTDQGNIIKKLGDQYELLMDNIEPLLLACDNDDRLRQLREAFENALENYMKAQYQFLVARKEQLKGLEKAIVGTQLRLKAALVDLTDIHDVLNTITQVVNEVVVAVSGL